MQSLFSLFQPTGDGSPVSMKTALAFSAKSLRCFLPQPQLLGQPAIAVGQEAIQIADGIAVVGPDAAQTAHVGVVLGTVVGVVLHVEELGHVVQGQGVKPHQAVKGGFDAGLEHVALVLTYLVVGGVGVIHNDGVLLGNLIAGCL